MAQQLQGQEQTLQIGMRLSQQQLRFVRMLEMTAPELDEAVERELEDNPALDIKEETTEEETHRYPLYTRPSAPEQTEFLPPDESENLYDSLLLQLSEKRLSPMVESAARFIIGSLDSNGYLTRSLREIIDDMAFGPGIEVTKQQADEALEAVRSLDPPGIGAFNLQDCLRMQLEAMPESDTRRNALRIINEAYEAFTKKHKERITKQLKLPKTETDDALDLILSLNPKPGAALGNDPSTRLNTIVPDFVVTIDDDRILIALNNRIPELCIEQGFEESLANIERTPKGRPKKGSEFIVTRVNDARDFIKVLTQRQNTMMTVMSAIVSIQREYFLTEDVYRLKPMMIKNVAELTGLDMSVISRVTSNKFVALPWGTFPLRFFFSDSIGEGEGSDAVTNRKIEDSIVRLIEAEDKHRPLSDQKIMEEMQRLGFDLSRRTVAKYRDRQGIPVARLRKEL